MKNMKYVFLLLTIAVTAACYGKDDASKLEAKELDIAFTTLSECTEAVENPNDAASVLVCPPQRDMPVKVTTIGPDYFYIELVDKSSSLVSDFSKLSDELPLAPGKVIEWHLNKNKPKFMVFRISWGTKAEPFKMAEYLTVHLVTNQTICPLATINVRANKNANHIARELISGALANAEKCPESIKTI